MFSSLPKPGNLPEPSAEHRGSAANLAQAFAGYIEVGFTRDEALELVKTTLQEVIRRLPKEEDE